MRSSRRLVALLFFVVVPGHASIEAEAQKIIDAIYNVDFETAQKEATALEMAHPGYPAGVFYRGMALFQSILLETPSQEKMWTQFEQTMRRTLILAKRMEENQPALSHYYQGAALGFLARIALARHHYPAAISKARQGRWHLAKALSLEPDLEDAYLGVGMYDYFADRAPAAIKPFTYLMAGVWGNRERGLRELYRTEERGQAARIEAMSIVAAIDSLETERRWDEARQLFTMLMERYPHNPRFRLGLSYVLERQGRWAEALSALDLEGSWLAMLDARIRPLATAWVEMRAVENLLFLQRYEDADRLLQLLEAQSLPENLRDWVLLRRGNWLDAKQKTQEAGVLYDQLRFKKPLELAAQFKKTPFPDGPRDALPNHWPLPVVPD